MPPTAHRAGKTGFYCPKGRYSRGIDELAAGLVEADPRAATGPPDPESAAVGVLSGACATGGTESSLAEAPERGSGLSEFGFVEPDTGFDDGGNVLAAGAAACPAVPPFTTTDTILFTTMACRRDDFSMLISPMISSPLD